MTRTPTTSRPTVPTQRRGGVSGLVRAGASAHLGGLPRTFWILFGGQLVNRIGGMVAAFLVLYLGARGLSAGQIGLVLLARGVGSLVSQPVGGLLADRVGRRFTLLTGLVATSLTLVALGAAHTVPLMIVAAAALGLVSELYRPAASALVADVVPFTARAKAYGLMFWAVNLGFAVASVLAGFLAEHGYWLLFAVDAGSGLAFAVIIAVGIRRDPVTPSAPASDGPQAGYRTALRDPLLVALVLLTLAYATVYNQAQVAIPLAIRDHGLSAAVYGTTAALNGILIVVLQPLLTTWLARFDRMRVLAVSWALVGAGMALTGLAHSAWQYAATVVVWTVGEVGTAGFTAALVADLAPADARGRYQALFGWGWSAASLLGPTLGTTVYGTLGPGAVWTGCLAIGLVSGVCAVVLSGRVARRRAVALAAAMG
ncbi:MDR family MFS transporter [Actinocatenispora rupis]|uniref:MFS transporter n=1 Tax=Actinocatenispora rupis TaxID=519421 RepID=A0A8J3NBF9_9ACTN|nr:MFS transporter [Actinocatenispora rupis]GID13026.1 MFS transporter [Actinocatenispora rupis]